MKRLKLAFAAVASLIIVLWLASVELPLLAGGFWAVRGLLVPLTGILAITFMAVAVLLAARPVQVEAALGGLDKFYRLHKWLGIAAVSMAVLHWLVEKAPKWLVELGWLAPRVRVAGADAGAGERPFAEYRDLAADLGEWAFYLLLVLAALALWRRFPYHLFFKTHRLMAPMFLVLTFHAAVLTPASYWSAPIGWLIMTVLAAAAVAAGLSIFGRIGKSHRFAGEVTDFHVHAGNSVLDVGVKLTTAWPGHAAGQFAFLTFTGDGQAHPFTISSGWANTGRLAFSIKGLGDYTRRLPTTIAVGEAITIEGPYGRFDFEPVRGAQLWIAGGVGITPFIARMEALTMSGHLADVDLIYSTAAPDDGFIAEVRNSAAASGVRLHLVDTGRDGFVDLEKIEGWVPEWRKADVWFCGPAIFGDALHKAMRTDGLPAHRFHRELFQMR
ncbi:putative ferric reductase [Erythromicrobium ramosum]|uniref:Ferric reductase n=1 Tax=Erythrobacter ramosus TaxID=35811 RepID=A0A6I4UM40_9SPHN|nr:ferric reductase-like transmembrane domain-containing protein [Erythrobacter ramosus]MBB3777178.1 putative ferric reductase [Erythrobacter ramosus]MXP39932.1 ferric reductase [Erythrobacter ramosus]